MKFFSMLPYTREETILYNFESTIRYNLCIKYFNILFFKRHYHILSFHNIQYSLHNFLIELFDLHG